MDSERPFHCDDCNMTFRNNGQLQKHKDKFCIGTTIGDPNHLVKNYSGPVTVPAIEVWSPSTHGSRRPYSPVMGSLSDIRPVAEGRSGRESELSNYSESSSVSISVPRNNKNTNRVRYRDTRGAGGIHHHQTHHHHLVESYDDQYNTKRSETHRDPNYHAMQVAEEHGRQIATIRNRNFELERQKEDIRRRLEELANRDFKDLESYRTNKVIEDLKDQENKNSKILVDLKTQMESLSARELQDDRFLINLYDRLFFSPVSECALPLSVNTISPPLTYDNSDGGIKEREVSVVNQSVRVSQTSKSENDGNGLLIVRSDHNLDSLDSYSSLDESTINESPYQRKLNENISSELMKLQKRLIMGQQVSPTHQESKIIPWPSLYPTGSLLAEISAMRQAYIDGGGKDPVVLAQLSEMLFEAQNMETMRGKTRRKKKKPQSNLADQLIAFEMENQRLQRELLQLQAQNLQQPKKEEKKDNDEDKFERQMKTLQMEHLQKMQQLQQEMELVRHQLALEKYRKELDIPYAQPVQQPVQQQPPPMPPRAPDADIPQLNLLQQQVGGQNQYDNDPLFPSNYDSSTGFVIFHDFILGLDAHIKAVRLIVSLYNAAQEMGDPSVLPTTFTEQSPGGGYDGGSLAVIGAKQPVPRCPPQPDMALLIELQTAESTHAKLSTRAWSKLDVFDDQGRLNSGRWRISLKGLPIKPELSTQEVSTMPTFGQVDLYIRVVNSRDSDRQSHASISTSNINNYRNPPVRYHSVQRYSPGAAIPPPPSPGRNNKGRAFSDQSELVDLYRDKYHTRSQNLHTQLSRPITTFSPIPQPLPPPPTSAPLKKTQTTTPRSNVETPKPNIETHRSNVDTTTPPNNRLKPVEGTKDTTVGFQVIRVRNADPGEAKVRLTGYYTNTGKVAQSFTSPITCSTTAVRSNFKYRYHIYGQQEATFHGVDVRAPIMLVARFYLRKSKPSPDTEFFGNMELSQQMPGDEKSDDTETFVAWGAVPLIKPMIHNLNRHEHKFGGEYEWRELFVNTGTHEVQLFLPPVPTTDRIPIEEHFVPKEWIRYGKANVRLHIFHKEPRPGSVTPSDVSEDEDNTLPEIAWIPVDRKLLISEQFTPSDGFDLYIDGCRFLPDSVTITRVAGRIFSRRYEKVGRDISAIVRPNTGIYNPKFEHKVEFREPNIPPSSTLLLKVYTIDRFSNKMTVVGYSALNIFVETGTEKQPFLDEGGQQISLNEGAHQIRLYHFGPNGTDPLTEASMRDSNVRVIPCASLLVRLVRAPLGSNGLPLTGDKIPEKDWARYGLWVARPHYSDGVYLSLKCEPMRGEKQIYKAMLRRPQVTVAEAVEFLSGKKILAPIKMEQYMRNHLTKLMDTTPQDQDMTFISKYTPSYGIKVAIDTAMNVPWSGFTHAVFCLNPPGAFYMGAPHASYDKPTFTSQLDLYSTNKSPTWKDGFKHFFNRSFHRYMCVIIHLQEISVTVSKENYKYGLLEQGWTALQVFNDMYANTQIYQLPLFHGAPTQSMLKQLAQEPCLEFIQKGLQNKMLQLLEGASIFVRLCDARRDEELMEKKEDDVMELNTEYIPLPLYQKYTTEVEGQQFIHMIPPGKSPSEFNAGLASKFKSLVYKLYEEGSLNV